MVRLDRRLAGSLYYPVDYGIFPQTLCGDGDPLDLLLIVNEPTFSGCMVECRILGLFRMWEKDDEDYKILAVPAKDPSFRTWTSLEQVTMALREEIEHFFNRYKELEGAPIRTLGFSDEKDALAVVAEMHRRYVEGRKRLLEKGPRQG
jgi:inorganic pyrophosphatase